MRRLGGRRNAPRDLLGGGNGDGRRTRRRHLGLGDADQLATVRQHDGHRLGGRRVRPGHEDRDRPVGRHLQLEALLVQAHRLDRAVAREDDDLAVRSLVAGHRTDRVAPDLELPLDRAGARRLELGRLTVATIIAIAPTEQNHHGRDERHGQRLSDERPHGLPPYALFAFQAIGLYCAFGRDLAYARVDCRKYPLTCSPGRRRSGTSSACSSLALF